MRHGGWLVLALLWAACGSSSGGDDLGARDVPSDTEVPSLTDLPAGAEESMDAQDLGEAPDHQEIGPDFTVVTYNTGLAVGYVDWAPQRVPFIGEAIRSLEADVVCLQEVWADMDGDAIIQATSTVFPHSFRMLTSDESGGEAAACTSQELDPLAACTRDHCSDVPPENLANCVLGNCGDQFNAISSTCQTCLVSQLGNTLDDMVAACSGGAGGQYAYGGRNGLLLLSRHPLTNQETLVFESYLNRRVALHVVVQDPSLGAVDVYCTHLTADLSDVPYGGTKGSWGAEQGLQVDALTQWVEQTRSAVVVVVAGDMNCGPEGTNGVTAEHGENYQKFLAAGFSDPYFTQHGDTCSWCADNPLVGGGSSSNIDHVFVRGSWPFSTSSRVLDQPVTLPGPPEVETRLSDHYGVSVTVVVPLI
ncbi:MAG TPA: endonuclease/exonuclease/phosphatase family protein [Myxococcota bacterium]|nr:endonuclease/exonuclease/phosphatase family protein [Myxococcota bacterium]HQK51656.1 endonuclease/exonuclease/phosphatase family protein [Myxococcota bacterium]